MTVYADEAFLLNGAVDYLLLVCAAKLGGGRILRLRLALAAAFGGVYAAAALFPALAFLRQLPVKLASLAAMLLIAFGAGRGTLRTGALEFQQRQAGLCPEAAVHLHPAAERARQRQLQDIHQRPARPAL